MGFFLKSYSEKDSRIHSLDLSSIQIKEGVLVSSNNISSYHAAIIASFFRELLVKSGYPFSFETVMSHQSKVEFMKTAKNLGFKVYLYFICTLDPKINEQRVLNRVNSGGHPVSPEKIVRRYYASLSLLKEAFLIADRAFIIDSSSNRRNLILEKDQNKVTVHSSSIPGWVDQYLLNLIH